MSGLKDIGKQLLALLYDRLLGQARARLNPDVRWRMQALGLCGAQYSFLFSNITLFFPH